MLRPLLFSPTSKSVYQVNDVVEVNCFNDNEQLTGRLIWEGPAGNLLGSISNRNESTLKVEAKREVAGTYICKVIEETFPAFSGLEKSFVLEVQCKQLLSSLTYL